MPSNSRTIGHSLYQHSTQAINSDAKHTVRRDLPSSFSTRSVVFFSNAALSAGVMSGPISFTASANANQTLACASSITQFKTRRHIAFMRYSSFLQRKSRAVSVLFASSAVANARAPSRAIELPAQSSHRASCHTHAGGAGHQNYTNNRIPNTHQQETNVHKSRLPHDLVTKAKPKQDSVCTTITAASEHKNRGGARRTGFVGAHRPYPVS